MKDYVTIDKPPSFVIEQSLPAIKEPHSSMNVYWLLIDRQLDLSEKCTFVRRAMKILDEVGVKNCANISIPFAPTDDLKLHSISILRGDQRFDKLDASKIKVIQREKDLESGIYDGRYYMIYFLDDVRVGDILDYSFSTKDLAPILKDHFIATFPLQFPWDVGKIHYRMNNPFGDKLKIQHSSPEWEIFHIRDDGENSWLLENVKGCVRESNQPIDCNLGGSCQLSTFSNWKEVVDWALPKYEFNRSFKNDPEVIHIVSNWEKSAKSAEEKALFALRFVQDEIRYLGMEEGLRAFQPDDPLDVLNQRFGDCKGKTQLLRAFLECLDISSHPCLVNANENPLLEGKLPSPFVFDHVITCIDLKGKKFFVDPTMMFQGGNLENSQCLEFKNVLIIANDSHNYTELPINPLPGNLKVETALKLNSDHSAKIGIKTFFSGMKANYMRYRMHVQTLNEIEKFFLSYLSPLSNSIKIDSPLELYDDRENNEVIAIENYAIENFWDGKDNFVFVPLSIYELLCKNIDTSRQTPLALDHPHNITEEIHLHGILKQFNSWEIEHPAFNLTCSFENLGNGESKLVYDYKTLLETLAPGDVADYAKQMKKAKESCEIQITKNFTEFNQNTMDTPQSLMLILILVFSILTVKFLYKKLA